MTIKQRNTLRYLSIKFHINCLFSFVFSEQNKHNLSSLQFKPVIHTGILVSLIVSGIFEKAYAQEKLYNESLDIGWEVLLNPTSLKSDLPFWFHSQQFGMVDQASANTLIFGHYKRELKDWKGFDLSFGMKPVARLSSESTIHINEGYAKANLFGYTLAAGRFEDPMSTKEDELSTGSFMVSRNATPVPKLAIYTDGFLPIPGLRGIVNYKGYYSHGWFENNRYATHVYLHQKYFYLNIKYAFFDAVGGIVHNVQWGGASEIGKYPSDFRSYLEAVFALGATSSNAASGEKENAVGNALAAYDFSLGLDFKPVHIRLYRLFYLEDKVSTRFRSGWDGIWGGVLKPKHSQLVQSVLYEHINTKRQDSFKFEPRGAANYYNHWLYRSGWTYQGRTIGNSLLSSNGNEISPIYNNIIIAHHIGISGKLTSSIRYSMKYTYSRNYGNVNDQIIQRFPTENGLIFATFRPLSELKKINQSYFLNCTFKLPSAPKYIFGATLAGDFGEFYGNRMGVAANFRYSIF